MGPRAVEFLPPCKRVRFPVCFKRGNTPLGLKLLPCRNGKGAYINGFTSANVPANLAIGDCLLSLGGSHGEAINLANLSFSEVLGKIEEGRKWKLRELMKDGKREDVVMIFERLLPSYSLRDIALDPRKASYLHSYLRDEDETQWIHKLSFWLSAFEFSQGIERKRAGSLKISEHEEAEEREVLLRGVPPDIIECIDETGGLEATVKAVEQELEREVIEHFRVSSWFGRMVAHLRGSHAFLYISFHEVSQDRLLREAFLLHLIQSGRQGWLQAWCSLQQLHLWDSSLLASEEIHRLQILRVATFIWDCFLAPNSVNYLGIEADCGKAYFTLQALGRDSTASGGLLKIQEGRLRAIRRACLAVQRVISRQLAGPEMRAFCESSLFECISGEVLSSIQAELLIKWEAEPAGTARLDAFTELWPRVDKAKLAPKLMHLFSPPANVSKHRPPLKVSNSQLLSSPSGEEGLGKESLDRRLQSLRHHLELLPALRRSGFRLVTIDDKLRQSFTDASVEWLLQFEGVVRERGVIIWVNQCLPLTPAARSRVLAGGSPVNMEPFLCPDLPASGRSGSCFMNLAPPSRLFSFLTPLPDGGSMLGSCLLLYRDFDGSVRSNDGSPTARRGHMRGALSMNSLAKSIELSKTSFSTRSSQGSEANNGDVGSCGAPSSGDEDSSNLSRRSATAGWWSRDDRDSGVRLGSDSSLSSSEGRNESLGDENICFDSQFPHSLCLPLPSDIEQSGEAQRLPYGVCLLSDMPSSADHTSESFWSFVQPDGLHEVLRSYYAALCRDLEHSVASSSSPQRGRFYHHWSDMDSEDILKEVLPFCELHACSSDRRDPATCASSKLLYVVKVLGPRNLCLVLSALLCERQVIFSSKRFNILSMTGSVLVQLLSPLVWRHVYLPLAPVSIACDLLHCPTPFLLGIPSSCVEDWGGGSSIPEDVVFLDIDTGEFRDLHALGMGPLTSCFDSILGAFAPGIDRIDSPVPFVPQQRSTPDFDEGSQVSRSIYSCITELLAGIVECCVSVGRGDNLTVFFDEAAFSRIKQAQEMPIHASPSMPSEEPFIHLFSKSQMLSSFIVEAYNDMEVISKIGAHK